MKKAFRPGGQHFQGDGISDINTAVDRNVHPVIFALAVRDAVLHHPVEVSDVGGRDPQPPSNLLSKDPRVDLLVVENLTSPDRNDTASRPETEISAALLDDLTKHRPGMSGKPEDPERAAGGLETRQSLSDP